MQSLALKEGLATEVWLPLALAEILMHLQGVSRFLHGKEVEVKGPAEILEGWVLPFMAEALKADAKEREALEFLEAIRKLKARQKKDV